MISFYLHIVQKSERKLSQWNAHNVVNYSARKSQWFFFQVIRWLMFWHWFLNNYHSLLVDGKICRFREYIGCKNRSMFTHSFRINQIFSLDGHLKYKHICNVITKNHESNGIASNQYPNMPAIKEERGTLRQRDFAHHKIDEHENYSVY